MQLQLLPDFVSNKLLYWHQDYVYNPLNGLLSSLVSCRLFPAFLGPNIITVASGLCIIPCIHLLYRPTAHNLFTAGAFAVLHDLLDRLDGAVARASHNDERTEGQRKFGAFFDAQMDKVFHIGILVAFLRSPLTPLLGDYWRFSAYSKIAVQLTLVVVRFQDYFGPSTTKRSIKAKGEGKLATCAANTAAAAALFTLGLGLAKFEEPYVVAGATAVSVLITISVDMALRSLSHKLSARSSETQELKD